MGANLNAVVIWRQQCAYAIIDDLRRPPMAFQWPFLFISGTTHDDGHCRSSPWGREPASRKLLQQNLRTFRLSRGRQGWAHPPRPGPAHGTSPMLTILRVPSAVLAKYWCGNPSWWMQFSHCSFVKRFFMMSKETDCSQVVASECMSPMTGNSHLLVRGLSSSY